MIIPYSASNFGNHWGPSLSTPPSPVFRFLAAERIDLAWAAFTAGKPCRSALSAYGSSSYLDGLAQACSILSVVDQSSVFIVKNALQLAQDKTELAYSSNKTGNALAKLASAQLFGVEWLFHVSSLIAGSGTAFWNGLRPDFVGLTKSRKWVVVEAKGRSGGMSQAKMNKGKQQTRSLRRINGDLPILRAVTQSYYLGNMLCGALEDPEEFDDDAIDLTFELNHEVQSYYGALRPFHIRAMETELLGRAYLSYANAIPGFDLALPRSGDSSVGPSTSDLPWRTETQGFFIYPDGVALRPALDRG